MLAARLSPFALGVGAGPALALEGLGGPLPGLAGDVLHGGGGRLHDAPCVGALIVAGQPMMSIKRI